MFRYQSLADGEANGHLDSIMKNASLDLGSGRLIAKAEMEAD
jgi:hypothetical protein